MKRRGQCIGPSLWRPNRRGRYLKFDGAGTDPINFFASLSSNGHGISEATEKSKRVVFTSEAGVVGGGR